MKYRFFLMMLGSLFFLIAASNLALLSKYNIYVGDDGYLTSYLYGYHFTGSRSLILCADWPIHQFLVGTLGAVYRELYHWYLNILQLIGLEYHYINGLSALLFLLTLAIYIGTLMRLQRRWLILVGVVIFGTLEPFLVMSHSVRTESVMILGLAAGVYAITRLRVNFVTFGALFFSILIILNTHLGGWPLIIGLSTGVWYVLGRRALLFFIISGTILLALYLALNNLFSIDALAQLLEKYRAQGSISSYTRWQVLNDVYSYFISAKYKRHLIELIIIAAFFLVLTQWRKLTRLAQGLLLTTGATFIAYILMFSYINPYYLVYFYYLMLVSTIWASNEIFPERLVRILALPAMVPFVVLYIAIFAMFISSPGWHTITAQRQTIMKYMTQGKVAAAPEYFVNLDPQNYRFFIPLAQAVDPKSLCSLHYPDASMVDVIVADTRQRDTIRPYLVDFTLADRVHIGRLATQSLSDDGDLFIYTRTRARTSKNNQ